MTSHESASALFRLSSAFLKCWADLCNSFWQLRQRIGDCGALRLEAGFGFHEPSMKAIDGNNGLTVA